MTEKKKLGLARLDAETRKRIAALGGHATKGLPKSREHRRKLREAQLRWMAKQKNE